MATDDNAMGQLARMYKLIEDHLRREELGLHALRMKDDIRGAEKSNWQVRDIFRTLDKHGCIIKRGSGKGMTYRWNPEAPSFTLQTRLERIAATMPGPIAVSKPIPAPAPAPIPAPEKMEIEFAGVVLTIGVNPVSGLFRIIVDQKPPTKRADG